MPSQQQKEKLIREEHYKTKKNFMKWNEAWASFLYKILTLNNAFTSLSDGCCLGTLNLKLIDWEPNGGSLWELVQFFHKKKTLGIGFHDQFLFMWELKVGYHSGFHI
jgi:hypothetical protein